MLLEKVDGYLFVKYAISNYYINSTHYYLCMNLGVLAVFRLI